MRHYRNPPRKSFLAYIIPFLILILFGIIIVLLVRFWDNINSKFNTETSYAIMETQEGDAKVKLWGTTDWKSVPTSKIKLFKGDSIRALPGSKVKVALFDKHSFVLNGNAEVSIQELRKENQTLHTSLELVAGEIWFDVKRDINPNSTFLVKTSDLELNIDGAVFDLESNVVRILKGDVSAGIFIDGKLKKTIQIGVGQELILTDSKKEALAVDDENVELLTMLADEFKLSSWYLYNMEGKTISTETNGSGEVIVDDEEEGLTTITDDINEEIESTTDFVLEKPVITSPAEDGEEFTITNSSQIIEGTVKKGTSKVIVNNYTLQSFKKGDTAWRYTASTQYDNLEKGKNEYEVYAVDEAGNKSEAAILTLIYGEVENKTSDVAEKTVIETTETKVVAEEKTASEEKVVTNVEGEGALKITEPNNGEDLTTTESSFVITGTAPTNAAKIVVSGYTLTSFVKGNTTWRYTADPQYGNITVGEANTYKAVAYDEDDKIIDTVSIVITVEEGESGTGTNVE